MQNQYHNFFIKLSKYFSILKWLMKDAVLRFKTTLLIILITSTLGVIFEAGAIGLAIFYAKALDGGKIITVLQYSFESRSSFKLFLFSTASILLLLLLSSWLIYFSQAKALKLGRWYEEFCSKRILKLFCSNLKFKPPYNNYTNLTISKLINTDSRYCGRILRIITNIFSQSATFIFCTATLFYINALLTLLVTFLAGLSLIPLYKINLEGARSSHLMEEYARGSSSEKRRIIQQYQQSSVANFVRKDYSIEYAFSSNDIKRYLDAFELRIKVVARSELLSNIFLSLVIFLIILVLGFDIFIRNEGWGELIVYLIALRYGLVKFKQLNKLITGINRFYPHIKRYCGFLESTEEVSLSPKYLCYNYVVKPINLKNKKKIPGSWESIILKPGIRISLITQLKLNRYTLVFLIECLLSFEEEAVKSTLSSVWFLSSNYSYNSQCSLRDFLSVPHDYSWQKFGEEISPTGLWHKVEQQLPSDLDTPITVDSWNQLDLDLKFALALLNALRSNCQWIFVEEQGLQALPSVAQQYFLEHLSDKITVIIFNNSLKLLGNYDEDVVAVMNENELMGLGSLNWFAENKDKIESLFIQSNKRNSKDKVNPNFNYEYDEDDE